MKCVCEPYRALIEQGLGRGRNAMAIWQDLVSDHNFPHGYQTVKRFVRKLRGSESMQAVGIILTPVGEESQVDYGTGPMVLESPGDKYRRTRLFVLTLGIRTGVRSPEVSNRTLNRNDVVLDGIPHQFSVSFQLQ